MLLKTFSEISSMDLNSNDTAPLCVNARRDLGCTADFMLEPFLQLRLCTPVVMKQTAI